MMIGAKDRSDYRLMSDTELLEEAKYTPNTELAIVLAERLYSALDKIEEMEALRRERYSN
jgi:hypothetical protein